MKKLAFLIVVLIVGCTIPTPPDTVLKDEYLKLTDSIMVLHLQTMNCSMQLQLLQDSIVELTQRPLMTSEQFLLLYKYERLNKYYLICKKKPTQWKYYKGWSTRVFEQ